MQAQGQVKRPRLIGYDIFPCWEFERGSNPDTGPRAGEGGGRVAGVLAGNSGDVGLASRKLVAQRRGPSLREGSGAAQS